MRPLKLLVPSSRFAEAQELAAEVLAEAEQRRDVVVPVADAWVLPYYVGILVRHLQARSRERGGRWNVAFTIFKMVLFAELLVLVVSLLAQLYWLILSHLG